MFLKKNPLNSISCKKQWKQNYLKKTTNQISKGFRVIKSFQQVVLNSISIYACFGVFLTLRKNNCLF